MRSSYCAFFLCPTFTPTLNARPKVSYTSQTGKVVEQSSSALFSLYQGHFDHHGYPSPRNREPDSLPRPHLQSALRRLYWLRLQNWKVFDATPIYFPAPSSISNVRLVCRAFQDSKAIVELWEEIVMDRTPRLGLNREWRKIRCWKMMIRMGTAFQRHGMMRLPKAKSEENDEKESIWIFEVSSQGKLQHKQIFYNTSTLSENSLPHCSLYGISQADP
ncbi:hypothetical protein BCR34DRAFT_582809 [Clohesyomyces aquaticus]|uniref:Uncharacterized protein n=1 Tax=Clohesyomyces aquaticus TaxID=1231657 RepID=A0A1Y2A7R7_9PLEO|nr:hypothetical protein BCR34DRAFT_582809 [Clohesyomyces aquaticus]